MVLRRRAGNHLRRRQQLLRTLPRPVSPRFSLPNLPTADEPCRTLVMNYIWPGLGLFAFGRLLSGVGMFYIPPRLFYLFFTLGCISTSIALLVLPYDEAHAD